MLLLTYLERGSNEVPQMLQQDLKFVLQKSPLLLEEMFKIATLPRPPHGNGWLVGCSPPPNVSSAWHGWLARSPPLPPLPVCLSALLASIASIACLAVCLAPLPSPVLLSASLPSLTHPTPKHTQTPAVACVEMQQCISQALSISLRKPVAGKPADATSLLLQVGTRC